MINDVQHLSKKLLEKSTLKMSGLWEPGSPVPAVSSPNASCRCKGSASTSWGSLLPRGSRPKNQLNSVYTDINWIQIKLKKLNTSNIAGTKSSNCIVLFEPAIQSSITRTPLYGWTPLSVSSPESLQIFEKQGTWTNATPSTLLCWIICLHYIFGASLAGVVQWLHQNAEMTFSSWRWVILEFSLIRTWLKTCICCRNSTFSYYYTLNIHLEKELLILQLYKM